MTETRSDYQRKHRRQSKWNLFPKRDKNSQGSNLDINPDFLNQENSSVNDIDSSDYQKPHFTREEKIKRLKRRLNLAIMVVLSLTILVFVALFYL
ncbi:hypothetical protein [Lactobacillus psittaci]|uniref:Uncharacterized protein n=1 Tax=Lactobacillus psittaci DSM 15354 TaxID=1122152 RepID=A0A0R1S4C3_9LACO|nr:hypothetical protein [Lactobacillus psittaci]KRL63481.1 hypothetical protein FC23_GL000723 [Lactobacillus psittaci DSM 15354]